MVFLCCTAVLQTVAEDGQWKQPEPEELEQLEEMQKAFFENLTNSGEQGCASIEPHSCSTEGMCCFAQRVDAVAEQLAKGTI